MDTTQRFCPHCKKFVQLNGEICRGCGLQFKFTGQENHFFSETFSKRDEAMTIPPETVLIDRFEINRHLGRGRFSNVYLAKDKLRSMDVALKVIEIGPCSEDNASFQVKQEILAHSKILNFEHVVQVHDIYFVPWGGTELLLLSMEHANGGTFRKFLVDLSNDHETRKTLGMNYFKQACKGIAAAHDAKIIHLDLKPENLLFAGDVLKVSDFGTAVCTQRSQESSDSWESFSIEVGTPIYMSPEHFITPHIDDLDERADIYSLGVILYELLHPKCRPPFGGSFARLRDLHLKVDAPRLIEAGEKLSSIIDRCLKKDPADRYQSAWELIDDLEGKINSDIGTIFSIDEEQNQSSNSLDETLERASLCYSQGNLNEAILLAEEILLVQPKNVQALELKKEMKLRFDQAELLYQEIAMNLEAGDLYELVEMVQEVVRIYPDHPSGNLVQVRLSLMAKRYRKWMDEGQNALIQENWESALDCLQKALQLNPEAVFLKKTIEVLTGVLDIRRKMNHALYEGEYKKAMKLARLIDLKVDEMKIHIPAFKLSKTSASFNHFQ